MSNFAPAIKPPSGVFESIVASLAQLARARDL